MGFTPIFYASTYGHAPVCKILIEARANVHCANEEVRRRPCTPRVHSCQAECGWIGDREIRAGNENRG